MSRFSLAEVARYTIVIRQRSRVRTRWTYRCHPPRCVGSRSSRSSLCLSLCRRPDCRARTRSSSYDRCATRGRSWVWRWWESVLSRRATFRTRDGNHIEPSPGGTGSAARARVGIVGSNRLYPGRLLRSSPIARADLAMAIESFVHATAPARFFVRRRDLIRPGGVLVICDDIRLPTSDPGATTVLERFCRGWHINA
jgi:hypothetical protein